MKWVIFGALGTDISYNDGASTPVIDWDKEDAILTITDPFFAFYLRWSDNKDEL